MMKNTQCYKVRKLAAEPGTSDSLRMHFHVLLLVIVKNWTKQKYLGKEKLLTTPLMASF